MLDQEQCSEVFAPEIHLYFFEMLAGFPRELCRSSFSFCRLRVSCSLLEDTDGVQKMCISYISFSEQIQHLVTKCPTDFSDLQLSGGTSSEIFRVSDDQIPSPGNPSKSHGSLPTTMSESKLFGHCRRFAEGLIPPIYIYLYLLRPYYRTAGKPFGGTDFHEMYLGDTSGNSMEQLVCAKLSLMNHRFLIDFPYIPSFSKTWWVSGSILHVGGFFSHNKHGSDMQ